MLPKTSQLTHIMSLPISFLLSVFFISDLYLDILDQNFDWHFYIELFFFFATIIFLGYQINRLQQVKQQLSVTENKLFLIQTEMTNLIEQQLQNWKLTKIEKVVAWLIIKGFSFKEIAEMRKVSEKTLHQQSNSIYKKAQVKNRHELISGILEDLLGSNSHEPLQKE